MAQKIAAELLIERLADSGVHTSLGLPGDGINGITEALRRDQGRVRFVDMPTNPDELPMPAKVSYEQAKKFAQAFLRGQPHKAAIASTIFRDTISELRS